LPSASPTRRSASWPGTNCSTASATAPAWSPDQILTEVTLYWFTNTSAAAGATTTKRRTPAPSRSQPRPDRGRVFADDFKTIRPLAERDNTNIVHWSNFKTGGTTPPSNAPRTHRRLRHLLPQPLTLTTPAGSLPRPARQRCAAASCPVDTGSPGCSRTPGSFGLHPSGGTSGRSFFSGPTSGVVSVAATRSAAAERRTGIDRRCDHNRTAR
jgi:hypothetical protein